MSKQRLPTRRRAAAPAGRSSPARTPKAAGPRALSLQSAAGFTPRPAVQRKLKVGAPGDAYEREADQVADRVMSGQPAPAISHLPASGLPATTQRAEEDTTSTGMEEETAETAQTQTAEEEEKTAQTQTAEEEEETAQTQTAEEEEKTAQTQTAEQEEETAQAAEMPEEEEKTAQTAAAEEMPEEEQTAQTQPEKEEEATAQAKSRHPHGARRDRSAAERAIRSPVAGGPLPGEVRQRIEGSTGADLADVRVHEGASAERAARALDARAFAHGRDIWLGPGESARDAHLMAHEATHVVQQTGRFGAARAGGPGVPASTGRAPAVQRTDGGAPAPPNHSEVNGSTLDMPSKSLEIPQISLPIKGNKSSITPPMVAQKPGSRETSQRLTWLEQVEVGEEGVRAATPNEKAVPVPPGGNGEEVPVAGGQSTTSIWYLRLGQSKQFLIGSRETLAQSSRLPNWKEAGTAESFQVDHMKDDQLGGPDDLTNLELLDVKTNRGVGNAIKQEIAGRIRTSVGAHLDAHPAVAGQPDPFEPLRAIRNKPDDIRRFLDRIEFKDKSPDALDAPGPNHIWTLEQIRQGDQLKVLPAVNDPSVIPSLGTQNELVIFGGEGGLAPIKIRMREGQPVFSDGRGFFGGVRGLTVNSVNYTPGTLTLNATLYKYTKLVREENDPITLTGIGGNYYTFQMPTDLTQTGIARALELRRASPITVESAAITNGAVTVKGTVAFSSKLFKNASADLVIEGEDVRLSKTFDGGEFDLPGPVDITDSSLTISVGTAGGEPNLMLDGEVGFEVQRVGKGTLRGQAGLATGIAVEGEFEFDPALFKGADAKIRVRYAEDKFSGEGTLKIGDGQIKGIRSAELGVKLEDDVWTADGTVEPKIPGVSEGRLSMVFDPDGGFEITGRLTLGAGIPRLKSGHLEATLKKEDEAYILSGTGSAELDIPGVAAAITAEYRDGLFKAEATVGYERGIAKGSVTVGATNMPVDENGTPGSEPGEQLSVYGQGTVTIRFTPWLEGTAGIKVTPDGQIEVKGRIALPDSVEIFPEKKIEKELISIGVDLPIVGVAVAGQRIGIFLNIGGNLTARASIGPGTLEDVAVEVTYNPEDEASAQVTGTARFVVPAEAGLRLAIRGSLGAGIPIVSAEAGLELGGELGVEGEASAGATVEWSPATGISMEADVSVLAHPKFTFDVTGFVEVTADLLLTEIDLYSKRWKLTSVEFGSNMEVGAKLKVMVENNEVKPISLDDIEFITPAIDPVETAKSLLQSL